MLHIGTYDSEPATFGIMMRHAEENGYRRKRKAIMRYICRTQDG